jgi:hypothetical protein
MASLVVISFSIFLLFAIALVGGMVAVVLLVVFRFDMTVVPLRGSKYVGAAEDAGATSSTTTACSSFDAGFSVSIRLVYG